MKFERAVIISNGRVICKKFFIKMIKKSDYIIAANGGSNHAKNFGLIPDIIIGDLDSISKEDYLFFLKNGSDFKKYDPIKNKTDIHLAIDYAIEQRSPTFTLLAQSFQAELALMQGQAHELSSWAEQAYANLHLAPMHTFYMPELTIPKVLLALGTPGSRKTAAECLQRIHQHAESTHNVRVLIEVLALEALLQAANNNEKAALAALEESLGLALPGGYIRLYVDLGPGMAKLLARIKNQEPYADYIVSILQAFPDALDHAAQTDEVKLLTEELTDREMEILGLLAKRYSNKEIAAELFISPSTVKRHTVNLYGKLSVHDRREAVNTAREIGLIPNS